MPVRLQKRRITIAFTGCLLVILGLASVRLLFDRSLAAAREPQPASATSCGYCAAVYGDGCFLAVGTGGRLDRIFPDKQVETVSTPATENLTDVWAGGATVLACGENGTLLYSEDGTQFIKCKETTRSNLFGVTCFNGTYFACAEHGLLLSSGDGKDWNPQRLETGNDVIAIASNDKMIMAITRESDIFISHDGQNWTHTNFNKTYDGYYQACRFTTVSSLGDTFFIAGYLVDSPDKPYIVYSETGEVWVEKPLSAINGAEPDQQFPLTIHAIVCDTDQILAACDRGRILTITNCAICNQLTEVGGKDLRTIAYGGGMVLAAGDDFFFDIINDTQARQDQIQAEQAHLDFQSGAVIVDVREDSELKETGYITGSIHIPLAQIQDRLPQAVPNRQTELIFYCAKGARAQKALEIASSEGYERVYNLGGLSDWPYEITK